jgi:hypothetical protein
MELLIQLILEEYDGTTWTAGGSVPTALEQPGGGGTLTAGLYGRWRISDTK